MTLEVEALAYQKGATMPSWVSFRPMLNLGLSTMIL